MTETDADDRLAMHRAQSLLAAEQQSLVRFLHDDLGQNLVAIKSFAAAIMEQHDGTPGASVELAVMISEAAESAYRSSYNLMQELRAQDYADREIDAALEICLQEARLRENNIEHVCRIGPSLGELDLATRAMVLRNVRCFVDFCKSLDACTHISVDLQARTGAGNRGIDLTMVQTGKCVYLDREDPALMALGERIAAVGGEMQLEVSADREKISLGLQFDPLQPVGEARA